MSKLVWLLNYPVQHFVATLDQIAKKWWAVVTTPAEKVEETPAAEVAPEVAAEPASETTDAA